MLLLMTIKGDDGKSRKFLTPLTGLFEIKGMEGDILVHFASGGKAIIAQDEVDQMYADAQKVLNGDTTKYVPGSK